MVAEVKNKAKKSNLTEFRLKTFQLKASPDQATTRLVKRLVQATSTY